MKNKLLSVVASAALCIFSVQSASADTAFAECLSQDIVEFDGTVVDAALATPALSTLVDAVVAAGLVEALSTAENITVYAPTNDAFAAIPEPIIDTILGDLNLLTAVLTYHVTPLLDDPRRYVPAVRRPTLQGQKVYYSRVASLPRVNNASVECQGVKTDNGLVWIINSVLLPNL